LEIRDRDGRGGEEERRRKGRRVKKIGEGDNRKLPHLH